MSAFEQLKKIVETHHDYARQWQARTGGKVLGYFCTYVPEELAYAINILPVRILGGLEPQDVSEAYIPAMYCPFCRDCLAQGLLGKYAYIDGVASAKSCLHIGQAFRAWADHVPTAFGHYFNMPALLEQPQAPAFLRRELEHFKKRLEAWTGSPITPQALRHSIEVYNADRRRLRQLYELRKGHPPLISGTEAATAVLSSMLMDKQEHAQLLEAWLEELPSRQGGPQAGVRLMVVGSEIHDLELLSLIESTGATIVIEDYCMGSRYFWNEIPAQEDSLAAIAQRYLERPRCPIKDILERRRLEHILNLIQEYQAQGVLITQQKFCDPHEYDIPAIEARLKEKGIPSYFMELDVTQSKGGVRTRTEAFLEMLALEVA